MGGRGLVILVAHYSSLRTCPSRCCGTGVFLVAGKEKGRALVACPYFGSGCRPAPVGIYLPTPCPFL